MHPFHFRDRRCCGVHWGFWHPVFFSARGIRIFGVLRLTVALPQTTHPTRPPSSSWANPPKKNTLTASIYVYVTTPSGTNGPQENFGSLRQHASSCWSRVPSFSERDTGFKKQTQTQRIACPNPLQMSTLLNQFITRHVSTARPFQYMYARYSAAQRTSVERTTLLVGMGFSLSWRSLASPFNCSWTLVYCSIAAFSQNLAQRHVAACCCRWCLHTITKLHTPNQPLSTVGNTTLGHKAEATNLPDSAFCLFGVVVIG